MKASSARRGGWQLIVALAAFAALIGGAAGMRAATVAASSGAVFLFTDAGPGGTSVVISTSTPDLGALGFDNLTSALAVSGGLAVAAYAQPTYGGACETFVGRDVSLVDNLIGNDTISSIKIGSTCFGWVPGTVVMTDLQVITGSSPGIQCPYGYTKKNQDLNQNAGGDWIYACVKWGPRYTSEVINFIQIESDLTAVTAKAGCSDEGRNMDGIPFHSELIDVDLNRHAGGSYVYFCLVKFSVAEQPAFAINDIDFLVYSDRSDTPAPWGGSTSDAFREACTAKMGTAAHGVSPFTDLNALAGGKYIYLCYSYAKAPIVPPDLTAPTIEIIDRTPANAAGWNNTAVTVSWSCADDYSGPVARVVSDTLVAEGANQSATGLCADLAGNTASDAQADINIDTTAPTLTFAGRTPDANTAGWNNTAVTVSWNCADALSGPASARVDATVSSEGVNQTAEGRCADLAGNTVSASYSGLNIDTTPPAVIYTGSAGSYTILEAVSITCAAADALSGLASTTCQDITGPAYAFAPGDNTFSATATDKAGNAGSGAVTFTVAATYATLCDLTRQFIATADVTSARAHPLGRSLCAQLGAAESARTAGAKAGAIDAYIKEVRAATPGIFTPAQEQLLIAWARSL
ncbi:MAG: hypothetical protein M3Q65_15530 [Chloroflexota bacterium]|nr:hypothetical protein [Chloroflexota bacterium]